MIHISIATSESATHRYILILFTPLLFEIKYYKSFSKCEAMQLHQMQKCSDIHFQ